MYTIARCISDSKRACASNWLEQKLPCLAERSRIMSESRFAAFIAARKRRPRDDKAGRRDSSGDVTGLLTPRPYRKRRENGERY